jgi:membrane-associated protein
MDFLIDFILHFDTHLGEFINNYGGLTYLILFVIVFCETGLVVTPFLPGDSMLFAAGAFAAIGVLNVALLFVLLSAAAFLGDTANYHIGKKLSHLLAKKKKTRFIKQEYTNRTVAFFDRHGGKTIVIARFIPIIRTFAPFVAGSASMRYPYFIRYNLTGGLCWVALFTFGGYFFGNLSWVKENFSVIIIAIILISLVPAIIMGIASQKKKDSGAC